MLRMIAPTRFDPPRRKGIALHASALLLCIAVLAGLLFFATTQTPGPLVVVLLIVSLLVSAFLPIFFYRLYALLQSGYWVGRDGVRLRWGLRLLDLPYGDVLDVARASEVDNAVELPRWNWAGAVTGTVQNEELGSVEYMASNLEELVLLGTKERVYVISPPNAAEFVAIYKRESERGSLRPIRARSISPSFVLVEAWAEKPIRRLLVAGALLAMGLLLFAGLLSPSLPSVSLGFGPDGEALPAVAGVQLFLLPALNLFFYMGSFVMGLLFYREAKGLTFSYLLWGSSLVSSLFFLGAVLFSI
jgi:hypothetical protein